MKKLTMTIEYGDRQGLEEALNHFLTKLKSRSTNHEELKVSEAILEWSNVRVDLPNYRIEHFEGMKLMVIPSKMNEL